MRSGGRVITVSVKSNSDSFIAQLVADERQMRDTAMVRALNKTADQVKVQAARAVRDAGYGIKIADIKRGISVRYAKAGEMRALVVVNGRPIPLIQYSARQTAKGVSVSVKAGRKLISGAFIATMPSGHKGVFVRQPDARHRKVANANKPGWHALPIRELFGPSVPDGMANDKVQAALQQFISDRFPKLLDHESQWLARRGR